MSEIARQLHDKDTYQTTASSKKYVVELEERSKLERLVVPHEVLDGEDGGQVPRKDRDDNGESRERGFSGYVGSEVLGEGDLGELGEEEVGEGSHCCCCGGWWGWNHCERWRTFKLSKRYLHVGGVSTRDVMAEARMAPFLWMNTERQEAQRSRRTALTST